MNLEVTGVTFDLFPIVLYCFTHPSDFCSLGVRASAQGGREGGRERRRERDREPARQTGTER